jgi:O-antigen/teichoic acid export membrane protein
LGVYKVAFDIAMKPIDAMAQPIYRVTYPVFARLSQQTEELAARFVDSSRYMLGLIAPIAVFVFVSSSDLLEVAAAERWVAAAPAIQVLCWAGLMRALTRLFDNLFFSLSRPDLALLDAVLGLVVLGATMPPLLFLLGDRFGILSVCFAWLIAYPLIFAVLFTFGQRLSPLRLSGYAKGLVPTAAAAGVMLLVLYASGRALVDENAWTRLLAQALIALGAYAIGLRYLAGVRFHHLGFRGDQAPVAAGSNFRSASARRS